MIMPKAHIPLGRIIAGCREHFLVSPQGLWYHTHPVESRSAWVASLTFSGRLEGRPHRRCRASEARDLREQKNRGADRCKRVISMAGRILVRCRPIASQKPLTISRCLHPRCATTGVSPWLTSTAASIRAVREGWISTCGCAWRRCSMVAIPLRCTVHVIWGISPDSALRHLATILGSMPQYRAIARLLPWHQAGSRSRARTPECVRMAALGTWGEKAGHGVRHTTFPRCADAGDRACYQAWAHASRSVARVTEQSPCDV